MRPFNPDQDMDPLASLASMITGKQEPIIMGMPGMARTPKPNPGDGLSWAGKLLNELRGMKGELLGAPKTGAGLPKLPKDYGQVVGPEYRLKWWDDLMKNQPEVARRLIERFPGKYPVK